MHKWTQKLHKRIDTDPLMKPVKEMPKPLTLDQIDELLGKYDVVLIWAKLCALAEWQETQKSSKKKVSAYRTLIAWLEKEDSQKRKGWLTTHDGAITWLERKGMKADDIQKLFEHEVINGVHMWRKKLI